MMSSLCHPHVMQTMMMCVPPLQTPMTSCHLIPMWHEWNMNTGDIMMMGFAPYANLVMSHWACTLCACRHGTCAIIKNGASKYPCGLEFMQADQNLRNITVSHSWVLNTQNANKNMPTMFLIVYLNENLRYCNENLAWGK